MGFAEVIIGVVLGFAFGIASLYFWNRSKDTLISLKDKEILRSTALLEDAQKKIDALTELNSRIEIDNAAKQAQIEAKNEQFAGQDKMFAAQIELLKSQIIEKSAELLRQKSVELGESNKQQISPLLDTVKEQIEKVERSMKETREKSVEQHIKLDTEIRNMMERTMEIGDKANNLADALKGKNKTQGIYGELILSEILKRSGLKEGIHFVCQDMIRDNSGNAVRNESTNRKMIPDVIVYYQEKDLIIDSKVSLTAYADWCNASTDTEREIAGRQHIASIKSHIKELTDKNYAAYRKEIKRGTLDYCVMFIPNEGALQLMRELDPSLWYDAYQKRVIIAGELSLFSLLKMIENFWVQAEQRKNQEEIVLAAENMLERVGEFYKIIVDIETLFSKVSDKFGDAKKKLCDGRQSIAVSGRQLKKLGVKSDSSKPLPEPKDYLTD